MLMAFGRPDRLWRDSRSRPETVFHFFLCCLLPVAEKEKKPVTLVSTDQRSWKCLFEERSLHLSSCFSACFFLILLIRACLFENQCVGAVLLQSLRSLLEEEEQSLWWNITFRFLIHNVFTSVPEVNMHIWGFYGSSGNNVPHWGLLSMLLWPRTLHSHLGYI